MTASTQRADDGVHLAQCGGASGGGDRKPSTMGSTVISAPPVDAMPSRLSNVSRVERRADARRRGGHIPVLARNANAALIESP